MSEANKQLVQRWFEQVWNQKSEAAVDEMLSQQGKAYGFPDTDSVHVGPEAFKTVHRVFCGAFPDVRVEIKDIVAEGDRVAIRWDASMTHLGDHLGFAASGKKAVMPGSSFVIVKDGKIAEGWNYMDFQAMVQKLQV
jgi:steroid delta-isomerase-like uncharacterized protein